ncbi:MAG TPA: DedA family protein [Methylomirabilota bacterium]
MDPGELITHWGYGALFVLVILGNMGLPLPEETILVLAGYMAWRGELRVPIVLAIGIVSAAGGDNIGYWLGHRFGRAKLERHSRWLLGHPGRLAMMQDFVARRGALAVFVARFVPGLRFMAGPLAGALGLPFSTFLIANLLGAVVYVPLGGGVGYYGLGYGLGAYLEQLRDLGADLEGLILLVALVGFAGILAWRIVRASRRGGGGSAPPPSTSVPDGRGV